MLSFHPWQAHKQRSALAKQAKARQEQVASGSAGEGTSGPAGEGTSVEEGTNIKDEEGIGEAVYPVLP